MQLIMVIIFTTIKHPKSKILETVASLIDIVRKIRMKK